MSESLGERKKICRALTQPYPIALKIATPKEERKIATLLYQRHQEPNLIVLRINLKPRRAR